MAAAPMGMPGWPELAFCTASAERKRMVLIESSLRVAIEVVGNGYSLFRERSPGAPVVADQLIGGFRSIGTREIGMDWPSFAGRPGIQNGLKNVPARLDHVRTFEQAGVADHGVIQQSLVAGAVGHAEVIAVIEVHIHHAGFE